MKLASTARSTPDAVALVHGDREVTFADLDREASAVAAGLAGLGVEAGDRVALWFPNHPAFASGLYGSWRARAAVVPMHSELTVPEARHVLADAGARVVICGPSQYAKMPEVRGSASAVEHVVVCDASPAGGDLSFDAFLGGDGGPVEAGEDDLALVAYTSGTSGLAKGAMLTHGNLQANVDQMRQTPIATVPDDVALGILPLFHIYGLNVLLNLCVQVGAKIVLSERFDPRGSIDLIRTHGVTRIAGAPPAYVAWLALADATASDFASIRVAVSGAAPLSKEALDGFRERFGVTIWEGYGLTETSPALTTMAMSQEPKAGSIGRPLPGVELRLVDEDGDDVEPGDPGEIIVRGPNVFPGYWQDPAATAEVIRDGWFHTGDVAVADDDDDLFIVDRMRDMVLVSGFNVYPREVETLLMTHPGVTDCAVVGDPDPDTGERVHAYVVARGSVSAGVLVEHCRENLAPYKVPSNVEIVDSIPRNAAGKVLRRAFRA